MKNALKLLMSMLVCFAAGLLITAVPVTLHHSEAPEITNKFLTSHKNVSNAYSGRETKAIKNSTRSAVRVISVSESDENGGAGVSFASGTYFKYMGNHYVLTVSHAVVGACSDLVVAYFEESSDCVAITYVDDNIDYAIIQVEEMHHRTPIRIPNSFVKNKKKMPKLLDKTFYTGYPNNIGPLTLHGRIAGFADNGYIFIDSYAWTGSSGSGVFDQDGKLIGIIMALDVGVTQYGADVLENLLIVVPTYQIDWTSALH